MAEASAVASSSSGDSGSCARGVVVEIKDLRFTYPGIDGHPPPGSTPLIEGFCLTLRAGDRCLLVGSNGAGKTTILKILGGKHLVDPNMVRVLGRSAFHDTSLTSSGDLSYLGGEWRRDVAFAGFEVSIQMDISAEKMIYGVSGVDPQRREELIKVLEIDLSWRMHRSSDGQRRRVQICMGLLKPFKVLLLDEITVDLDVLARANLLRYLQKECEERGATIIYATHIFDGLENWPTHVCYVAHGKLQTVLPLEEVKKMSNLSLMRTVESWLRKERDEDRKRRKERKESGNPEYEKIVEGSRVAGAPARKAAQVINNGWASGRLQSTVAGEENFFYSSNRVIRETCGSAARLWILQIEGCPKHPMIPEPHDHSTIYTLAFLEMGISEDLRTRAEEVLQRRMLLPLLPPLEQPFQLHRFSPRNAHPTKATITSISGLNMDTKRGPLLFMHQDMSDTASAEPTNPCIRLMISSVCFIVLLTARSQEQALLYNYHVEGRGKPYVPTQRPLRRLPLHPDGHHDALDAPHEAHHGRARVGGREALVHPRLQNQAEAINFTASN